MRVQMENQLRNDLRHLSKLPNKNKSEKMNAQQIYHDEYIKIPTHSPGERLTSYKGFDEIRKQARQQGIPILHMGKSLVIEWHKGELSVYTREKEK